MENHPIPQDVTGFQFKLIGNMTVKQFAYLATGVVFAWALLQLPVNILIKFPFSAFSALLGIGLAYFPISGRPMDLMIGNYIKALFRPTQFIYEKEGGQLYFPSRISFATTKIAKQYKNDSALFPRDKLKAYLESLNTTLQPVNPAPAQPKPPLPPVTPLVKPEPLIIKTKPSAGGGTFKKPIGAPTVPNSPNLISGITKDSRGNALSNILVEVKDSQGNPVRAFKTNEFGRFASATPLLNGSYTVKFEDPKAQNRFEEIAINVAGQIILPVEAVSVDAREELRRSLFNTN